MRHIDTCGKDKARGYHSHANTDINRKTQQRKPPLYVKLQKREQDTNHSHRRRVKEAPLLQSECTGPSDQPDETSRTSLDRTSCRQPSERLLSPTIPCDLPAEEVDRGYTQGHSIVQALSTQHGNNPHIGQIIYSLQMTATSSFTFFREVIVLIYT